VFNPNPRIEILPILPGQDCIVIDDALLEPERLIELAVRHREAFAESPHNAYPGIELPLPELICTRLDDCFARHARARLGGRRSLRTISRLALVTRQPSELQPRQWICHRDRLGLEPGRRVMASVLYLFRNEALGGTRFFRPLQPAAEIDRLVLASGVMTGPEFSARFGIAPGYPGASNDWFESCLSVPPAFNRLIFYDGMVFHAGDIRQPERLSADPACGRLTLNGFFTCRAALG